MSVASRLNLEPHGAASEAKPGRAPATACLAVVGDEATRNVVSAVCETKLPDLRIETGGTREVLEHLLDGEAPRILIVDVADSPKPLHAVLPIMTAFADDTRVIAIGAVNDIEVYREMLEAGVVEYLVKPVSEKALAAALARVDTRTATVAASQPERRTLVAVLGTRGGVGATTIAVNLAWLAANELRQRTTLLDLDLQHGSVALALDIEPTRGLREALEKPARIDSLFISSAAVKVGDRLIVMAAEESVDEEVRYDPVAVDLLLQELHRQTDVVIVDLPRSAPQARARVLAAASDVLIVSDLTLAGLRDAIRLHGLVQHLAPSARTLFAANRVSARSSGIGKVEFERALGHSLALTIPEDPKAASAAANSGKPIAGIARRSKAVGPLRSVAGRLCHVEPPRRRLLFWMSRRPADKAKSPKKR